MNDSTKKLIERMNQQDLLEKTKRKDLDETHFQYYLTRRETLFENLVKNHCKVEEGKLVLSSIIQEIDLDRFNPTSYSIWELLFGKAPMETLSYLGQEKILQDFQEYCQTQGLNVKGYCRLSNYSN